jgi:carbamoyltransferase
MRIVGLSAYDHDSAAAPPGRRQDRRGGTCRAEARLQLKDIDYVAFYDKPFLKFERLLETYVAFAPRGLQSFQKSVPVWIKEKLFQKDLLRAELERIAPDADWRARLLFAEHHISHAASAYYPSPFDDALQGR